MCQDNNKHIKFSIGAVDAQFDAITDHNWVQLEKPTGNVKALADEICLAHPGFYPAQVRAVRSHALTHPTLTNLRVYDQVVTMFYNCPQWSERRPKLYVTCLSEEKYDAPQFTCTCPPEWQSQRTIIALKGLGFKKHDINYYNKQGQIYSHGKL